MNKIAILFTFLLIPLSTVVAREKYDLQAALDRLDSVIAASPKYVAEKQERIARLNSELKTARNPLSRYNVRMRLYEEYRSYKNDSAISILQDNLRLARSIKRTDLANDCLSLIAFQSSTAGRYPEAQAMLQKVDTKALKGKGYFYYYRALNHLYNEIGYYAHIKSVKDSAYAQAGKYDALMMQSLDKQSPEYMQYLTRDLFYSNHLNEAQKVCDEWLKKTPTDSRDMALVAYYQYLIQITLHNEDEAIYWAARSAISDIMHAVMDQGSLGSVADVISGRDIDRSYRYIKFAWQCATVFGTDIRTKQISPILSVIESEYKAQLDSANDRLVVIAIVIALLAIGLLFMLYYSSKQRHRLAKARNDLRLRNKELAESNEKLKAANREITAANEKIMAVNEQLHESDEIKEAYIGRFLTLCSDYINRIDKSRRETNKLIKAHKIDELYQMTRSTEQKDKDVEELYQHFDRTFLNIFPNFVPDFNALLKPENRIDTEPGTLNTTLRIFALIRLGIDDSGKIAEFLHYSVNTIYNYRARTKNGAIGDRDSFEDEVKRLGKIA